MLGLNHLHLLFKSSSESTAWHCIGLIDHAYHALAVTIKNSHFKSYTVRRETLEGGGGIWRIKQNITVGEIKFGELLAKRTPY